MVDVTVIQQAPQPVNVGGVMDMVFAPIRFLMQHFQFILVFILVVVILTLAIMWFLNREEENKEQEDMLYKDYKDTIRTCKQNQDATMYVKKYSKLNLIFCLGLPFISKYVGRKVYDVRENVIGFYDGQYVDMLGNINILLWKTKSFFFFKDYFVLRLPQKAYTTRQGIDKKFKTVEGQTPKYETIITFRPLPEGLVVKREDKTQVIMMINHVKRGYYYFPVYQDAEFKMVDLTETINTLNLVNSSNILLESVIKESGKNVVGMAKTNTQLVYEQKKPEKVRDIDNQDTD